MRNRALRRQKFFEKKRVEIDYKDSVIFAYKEASRQIRKNLSSAQLEITDIAIIKQDPFLSITANKNGKILYGFAKRMPNDVPNDYIGIQVAVRDLLRNFLKK